MFSVGSSFMFLSNSSGSSFFSSHDPLLGSSKRQVPVLPCPSTYYRSCLSILCLCCFVPSVLEKEELCIAYYFCNLAHLLMFKTLIYIYTVQEVGVPFSL